MLLDLVQIQELPNPSSEEMLPVPSSLTAEPSLGDPTVGSRFWYPKGSTPGGSASYSPA